MKKLLSLLLTLVLVLSLAGCADSQTPQIFNQPAGESTLSATEGTSPTAATQTKPIVTLPTAGQTEPTESLPPQVDQTDPPETLPPQVDQTDPPETLPPQVDQTDPPETLPPQIDQTDPPETLPPQVDQTDPPEDTTQSQGLDKNGSYTTKEDVALYIHIYGCLPPNFMTKSQARDYGWKSGSLEKYAPGYCIGGDVFKNREGLLPNAPGRVYRECDIGTLGSYGSRGSKRIVYSNDGLIYYTSDHYESFTLLYGAP